MSAPPHIAGIRPADCFIHERACLTGLGDGRETWNRLIANESALQATPVFCSEGGDPVPLALRQPFSHSTPPRWWDDLLRFLQPLAGEPWGRPDHPIFVASSNYGIDALYSLGKHRDPRFVPFATPHGCVEKLSEALGWGANHFILSHACVSAQLAIDQAARFVKTGRAERALIFSFDYVGPFVSAGFHALKILNESFPAPYRDGETGSIGLGDGAAYLVLSRDDSPFRLGPGNTYNEMFHFTANEPSGTGFDAVLAPYADKSRNHRFWVKGHGTGTLEAGKLESTSVNKNFPDAPLVSWKGSLGHTLGSCASVELVLATEAIERGKVPGTVCSQEPFFAPNVRRESFFPSDFDSVLLLSNAFGGAHASLLLHYG